MEHRVGKWTEYESKILQRAVEELGDNKKWTDVSEYLIKYGVSRGATQCRHRWHKTMRPNLKKGPWNSGEDALLTEAVLSSLKDVGAVGKVDWQVIANAVLPSRTGKACRERWISRLDPAIDRSPFSAEEDAKLLMTHQALGNKWAKIAKSMNKSHASGQKRSRTADQVKSRYISLMRRGAGGKAMHAQQQNGHTHKRKEQPEPRNSDFSLSGRGIGEMEPVPKSMLVARASDQNGNAHAAERKLQEMLQCLHEMSMSNDAKHHFSANDSAHRDATMSMHDEHVMQSSLSLHESGLSEILDDVKDDSNVQGSSASVISQQRMTLDDSDRDLSLSLETSFDAFLLKGAPKVAKGAPADRDRSLSNISNLSLSNILDLSPMPCFSST
jgi:hypothetical protein